MTKLSPKVFERAAERYLIVRCSVTGLWNVMQTSPEVTLYQRSTLAKAKQSLKVLEAHAEHKRLCQQQSGAALICAEETKP